MQPEVIDVMRRTMMVIGLMGEAGQTGINFHGKWVWRSIQMPVLLISTLESGLWEEASHF